MRSRFIRLACPFSILCLAVFWTASRGAAQTPPSLGIQFAASRPSLSLTGAVGTVYSIQEANDLSQTKSWSDRTLIELRTASEVWVDPSPPAASGRFYRAVSTATPGDTNLVFIQPGVFTLGSPTNEMDRFDWEGPQTLVTISCGFWMGTHEVTQKEYLAVIGSNPSYFSAANGYADDLSRPVEMVSWSDATNYCAKLTQQARAAGRIATNLVYRLPTEAEWEYACRAATSTRFSYGDDPVYTGLASHGWYSDNSGGMTHPVGQKLPNPWGLYDMHGNVLEWCQDTFGDYPGGAVLDPSGPTTGSARASRGGNWYAYARNCRSASRFSLAPDSTYSYFGFRVVLALVVE